MRLIHTADWHLGKHIEGHSRLEEQELFLEDFVNIVKERDADVVLIAGDIYDSSNPPAKAEQLFYDTLKKISDGGRRLTIVIAGNHDNPDRLVSATPLAMEHGIIMVGTPKTVIPKGQYGSWEVCRSGEGYIKIERKSEQAVVLTVPFPSEKRLEEVLYSEMESEEIQLETYNERLRCLFDRLADQFEEETVNIIVSHLFVMDSLEEGSEEAYSLEEVIWQIRIFFRSLQIMWHLGIFTDRKVFRDTRIFAIPVHRSSIGKEKNVTKNRCCVWISERANRLKLSRSN